MEFLIRVIVVTVTWLILTALLVWLPTWWLWQNIVAPVFGLPTITLLECVGLLILVWLASNGMAKLSVKVGDHN